MFRKPVDRVKRAQSKIYDEDDINIWDDDSKKDETLIMEADGQVGCDFISLGTNQSAPNCDVISM